VEIAVTCEEMSGAKRDRTADLFNANVEVGFTLKIAQFTLKVRLSFRPFFDE